MVSIVESHVTSGRRRRGPELVCVAGLELRPHKRQRSARPSVQFSPTVVVVPITPLCAEFSAPLLFTTLPLPPRVTPSFSTNLAIYTVPLRDGPLTHTKNIPAKAKPAPRPSHLVSPKCKNSSQRQTYQSHHRHEHRNPTPPMSYLPTPRPVKDTLKMPPVVPPVRSKASPNGPAKPHPKTALLALPKIKTKPKSKAARTSLSDFDDWDALVFMALQGRQSGKPEYCIQLGQAYRVPHQRSGSRSPSPQPVCLAR
ncbi:hypothetical protein BJ085DRAFT_40830 [Dimargaris cristalligena]|uniref:Uncharacterized protein n=1 Tax=Dimargaris cristalligena TaxID=215637 RepID=A0A4P9ZPY3_9FUNG|nr:hypothetical protein BJ085DRAFT_40830 [Dimargaris cristalligena]|eukprot:RKP35516.1 hypothetical protein BJ085DRAFT_40830 [Dimargaris cristalligena]